MYRSVPVSKADALLNDEMWRWGREQLSAVAADPSAGSMLRKIAPVLLEAPSS